MKFNESATRRRDQLVSLSARKALVEGLENRMLLSAQLVRDINTSRIGATFTPSTATAVGGVSYFGESDGVNGYELWKTDGTTAGTAMVKDIYAGPAGSYPGGFTTVAGVTFFGAEEATDGYELWRTDGTAAGTNLVKDINPGSAPSNPEDLTAYNGFLYFFANDGIHGRELWKSDGTAAGTSLVMDTYPGTSGQANDQNSFHRIAVTSGNVLIFTALDGTYNNLYSITGNGSPVLYKQLQYYLLSPGLLANSTGLVFYQDIIGYVYQSNGTSAGTVTDDATNSSVYNMTIAGSYLYYVRNGLVKCVGGGGIVTVSGGLSSATILGSAGDDVFFSVTQTGTPQVWYTYGGGNYSGLEINYVTGIAGTAVGSDFDVVTGTSTTGYALYKIPVPVPASASIVSSSINAGNTLPEPSNLSALGSKLLFVNSDLTNGTQVWVSDNTAAGTALLKSIYPGTAFASPQIFGTVNNKVFFSANDGISGTEPYISDGTYAGTVMLKDIAPGSNGSGPNNVVSTGTQLYFSAFDSTNGDALWMTDGTPAGTVMLLANGSMSVRPAPMGSVNGWMLFSAYDATHGTELWRTDGTAANTQFLADLNPGSSSSTPSKAVVVNGYAYFTATDSAHGTELWRSDGTAAGTTLVDDIYPGSTSSGISSLFVYNNLLLFSAESTSNTGFELWKSDGTAAGTALVKDIYVGASSSTPAKFIACNGLVYFAAKDATTTGLWVTDGTSAGTTLVIEDFPAALATANGKLYFLGSAIGQNTESLFASSGTAGTTTAVGPIFNLATNSLLSTGGRLYFSADDGTGHGQELWSSDGTSAGTAMIQDLFAGEYAGANAPFAAVNQAVYCSGTDGVSGTELYKFPDIYPPELYAASASVAGTGPTHTISFSFTEDISSHLSASSLQLQDLTTSQMVTTATTGYSYNSSTNTATFTLPDAALIDGRYRATIAASLLVDASGNASAIPATLEFLSVAGSASDDTIRIQNSSDGTSVQVYRNSVLTMTTPIASLGSIIVTGGAGNDSLAISLGSAVPSGGCSFDGGTGTNSLTLAGTTGAHTVSITGGVLVYDAIPFATVNCGTFVFDPAGGSDSITDSSQLKLATAPGVGRVITSLNLIGTLDVNDNSVDLPGALLSNATSWAHSGFNSGAWNGMGISSSAAGGDPSHLTAVGVIQNNQSGSALFSASKLFDGIAPGASDVLLKYTYYGDANLSGKVDSADYTQIDNGYLSHGSLVGWYNGDFNYDGVINGSDYTLIDNAFNQQGAARTAVIAAQATSKAVLFSPTPVLDDQSHKRRAFRGGDKAPQAVLPVD